MNTTLNLYDELCVRNLKVKPDIEIKLSRITGAAWNAEKGRAERTVVLPKIDTVEQVGYANLECQVEARVFRAARAEDSTRAATALYENVTTSTWPTQATHSSSTTAPSTSGAATASTATASTTSPSTTLTTTAALSILRYLILISRFSEAECLAQVQIDIEKSWPFSFDTIRVILF